MKLPWGSRGPRTTPAEPTAAQGAEPSVHIHRSPGFEKAFERLPDPEACRVLDLGPARGPNVDFLASVTNRLQIVDAFDRGGGGPPRASADRAVQTLWDLLPESAGTFDLVLTWDLLNYFPQNRVASLIELLGEICRPGAKLHAIIASSQTIPAQPNRFRIADSANLVYEATTTEVRGARRMPPAEMTAMLDRFQIEYTFLLRHGVREYVAVRSK